MTRKRYWAEVRWQAEDIQTLREDWTVGQCEAFLRVVETDIQDATIERGWESIDELLDSYEEVESEEKANKARYRRWL
jgi:hypothetical protein